jgi:hypothetical protein
MPAKIGHYEFLATASKYNVTLLISKNNIYVAEYGRYLLILSHIDDHFFCSLLLSFYCSLCAAFDVINHITASRQYAVDTPATNRPSYYMSNLEAVGC